MDDSQTPRALIESLIVNNPSELSAVRSHKVKNISETPHVASVRKRRSPRNQISNKRSFSEAKNVSQMPKKHKSMMNDSENTVTPRSAIEAFLQGASNIEQTSKRSHKEFKVTPGKKFSSLSTSQINSSSRKTDLRKKATVKHLLKSQSFSSGPTPRGLIEGFIAEGEESTPAVKERSDLDVMNSTGIDEIIFSRKRNLSTLGESYYLPCSAPESSSHRGRMLRTSPRLRKQIDLEEFAQETADKMEKLRDGNETTQEIRASTMLTEVLTQHDVTSVHKKTRELESFTSGKWRSSVKGQESDISLASVTPDTASSPGRSRLSNISNKGCAGKKSGVSGSEQTWSTSTMSSAERLSTKHSVTLQEAEVVDGAATSPLVTSTRRSTQGSTTLGTATPLQTTDTPTTNIGRTPNSAQFKDQLLTGTIQEIVANVVPASDSVLSPATECNQNIEQLEYSTGRSLRSQRRALVSEQNKSSTNNTAGKSLLSSVVVHQSDSHHDDTLTGVVVDNMSDSQHDEMSSVVVDNRSMRSQQQRHNEIVEDKGVDKYDEEKEGGENQVESHMDEAENEADTDDEQVEDQDEQEEKDSDSNQDVSTDEAQDKENLPVTNPQSQDHLESKRTKKSSSKNSTPRLPRALTKGIFSHFSQFKFNKDVLNEVELAAESFWKNTVDDLSQYAHHANRSTLQYTDIELLMKSDLNCRQVLLPRCEDLLLEKYRKSDTVV